MWFELLATLILYKGENAILIHAIDITTKKKEQLERRKLEKKTDQGTKNGSDWNPCRWCCP